MSIRLLPDIDFSISGRLNFCKVSPKVWLSILSNVRPELRDVYMKNDDDKYINEKWFFYTLPYMISILVYYL